MPYTSCIFLPGYDTLILYTVSNSIYLFQFYFRHSWVFKNIYRLTELRVLEQSVKADHKMTWLAAVIQNSSFVIGIGLFLD